MVLLETIRLLGYFSLCYKFSTSLIYNEFTGLLPIYIFENLNAMMIQDKGKDEPTYLSEKEPFNYYNDSVELTMKGLDIKLQRILTIFTIIDLSRNKFEGEIPKLLGRL